MCILHIYSRRIVAVKKNVQNAHMADDFDALLAPLARLMVQQGVPFADLAERLKGHYVQAALAETDVKQTDSRLSVATGLSRREVARLKEFEAKPPKPNPLTRIVSLWLTQEGYHENGQPKPLPRQGDAPSFEALARMVLQDVHPRTFIDTLLATGTVVAEGKTLHLVERSYVPAGGSAEQIAYLSENVGDHLAAAHENIHGGDARHFERALHMSDLSAEAVDALTTRFASAQMELLEALQTRAEALKVTAPGDQRVRIGGYVYQGKMNK